MLNITDTHIHLQDFNQDFALKLLEYPAVSSFILVSASAKDFPLIDNLYKKSPQKIIPAFGYHPWQASTDYDLYLLREYLLRHKTSLVGEIGLDGIKSPPTPKQYELLSEELDLAKSLNKAVIIHGAKAFNNLKSYSPLLSTLKYVYHSFTPNLELLRFLIKTNAYIGLGKNFINHPKASQFISLIPQNKILFETDAPYQLKEENYLSNTTELLNKLSTLTNLTPKDLNNLLTANTTEFTKC